MNFRDLLLTASKDFIDNPANNLSEEKFLNAAKREFRECLIDSEKGDIFLRFKYWKEMLAGDPEYVSNLKISPYSEFLKSLHWKIVKEFVLRIYGNKCAICSSSENLNVHHKTYENRGCEHEHVDDLILLCNNCHAKFHDKLARQ